MSRFLPKAHACTFLLGALTVPLDAASKTISMPIATPTMYDRFNLRVRVEFDHGETDASGQKYGGIYNLISRAHVLINSQERHYEKSGIDLYNDNFKREGRENNSFDYNDVPTEFVQNIEYCFGGAQTVLGGVTVPDSAFALDLRHDERLGNQTYNSVELVLDIGEVSDVFKNAGTSKIKSLVIEVYGVELFHDAQSSAALGIARKRYAEIITKTENRKISDTALSNVFNLEARGRADQGINLSDLIITQLDEAGEPIPFDDENAVVEVRISELEYYREPVWQIRDRQNKQRLQGVPPNVLIMPLVQPQTGLGGLTPADLAAGAALHIVANKAADQTGETCLHVRKNYSYKT